MARKVLVRLVDDLDGLPSEDVATVTFSLDRVDYQIDLNESNASKLREGLADFVAAARRTGGRIKRGAGASARAAANDGPAIREWAREQGHQLAERGRIPSHIVDAFHAASGKGKAKVTRIETAEKPARRTAAKTAAASRTAASTTATTTHPAHPLGRREAGREGRGQAGSRQDHEGSGRQDDGEGREDDHRQDGQDPSVHGLHGGVEGWTAGSTSGAGQVALTWAGEAQARPARHLQPWRGHRPRPPGDHRRGGGQEGHRRRDHPGQGVRTARRSTCCASWTRRTSRPSTTGWRRTRRTSVACSSTSGGTDRCPVPVDRLSDGGPNSPIRPLCCGVGHSPTEWRSTRSRLRMRHRVVEGTFRIVSLL